MYQKIIMKRESIENPDRVNRMKEKKNVFFIHEELKKEETSS